MTSLRFEAAARAELLHEVEYYEATRSGTGRRFREAVDAALGRIGRASEAGKPETQGCRRMRITGFPFSIVYRQETSEIVVYAVRPDAREPGYWMTRVR